MPQIYILFFSNSGERSIRSIHKTYNGALEQLFTLRDQIIDNINTYIEEDLCENKDMYFNYVDILLNDDCDTWIENLPQEELFPIPYIRIFDLYE